MARASFKTALVLSGGSARALSHLGVLEEIEKNRIRLDLIVGASMGAIIGGLYACYGSAATVTRKMQSFFESDRLQNAISRVREEPKEEKAGTFLQRFIWLIKSGVYYSRSLTAMSLVSREEYLEIVSQLVPEDSVETLPIPFAAVAMDLFSGEEVLLKSGSLREILSASAAIPGILPPIELHGRSLVDGGWVDNVPVTPAIALGAHFVLAVDSSWEVVEEWMPPTSALEIAFRSNDLARVALNRQRRAFADVLLIPRVKGIHWTDFNAMIRCASVGNNAFTENVKYIRRMRALRRCQTLGGRLHPARSGGWQRPLVIY